MMVYCTAVCVTCILSLSPTAPTAQPSLATETVVSLFVSPWLGAFSDGVGRKVLLVGGPAVAATTLGWAAFLHNGSGGGGGGGGGLHRQHRRNQTLCRIALAISSQAWQIGYGATVSDIDLDPATEQGIEVASTLADVLAECVVCSSIWKRVWPARTGPATPSTASRRWLALAAAMAAAAAWCIATRTDEPLDENDRKPFTAARVLSKMARWQRQHPSISKAMLVAFLLESGRQHVDALEASRWQHVKGWGGSHERKLALLAATAALAASATIKPTLEGYGDMGSTRLGSWAHLFECVAHTPMFCNWRLLRLLSAAVTPSVAANADYTQGSAQEDAAAEAGCGHGEMNAAVCSAEAVSRQLTPLLVAAICNRNRRWSGTGSSAAATESDGEGGASSSNHHSLWVFAALHALNAKVFLPKLWPTPQWL